MNHVYRLVRNAAGQARPIPECGRGRGKSGGPALALLAALALPAFAQQTLPTGGSVAAGQASVASQGAQMTVTQSSDKAILNWQRFDIGAQAGVRFQQPSASSVALNRVLAGEASQIHGQLSANGQVYLINPAGIVFGPGSRVDVGGLVASVMDIADADFLAGKAIFRRNGATGSIVNQGEITAAEGGLVALLAPTVRNEGIVRAQLGNVALAAGDQVTLHAGADGHLQLAIAPATLQTLVENRQLIVADGGQVLMTSSAADALSSGVVANSGTVQARTLQEKEGRILLLADMAHGEVRHSGLLDASAPVTGNGGFVDTSAATVTLQDGRRVDTRAAQGATGTWLIDPNDYTVAASGGNITGAQLSADLASSNVTIATASQGTAGGNGDIFVNDAVGWSANTLTLNAERNIEINAVMTASGTAGLALNYGGTNGNPAATPASGSMLMTGLAPGVATGFTGRVDFPGRSGTGFLAINGQGYHVLGAGDLGVAGDASTTTLQGMANNLTGFYALGANIDASATAGWNGGQGFTPVGTYLSEFTGTFDGLGHTITGLTIDRSSNTSTDRHWVGLFGFVDDATLRNLGLAQGSVRGFSYVGALAGQVDSSTGRTLLHNLWSSSSVSGEQAGGLIGVLDTLNSGGSFTLLHAQASGNVTGTFGTNPGGGGGLVNTLNLGTGAVGILSDVHASGQIVGMGGAGLVSTMNLSPGATLTIRDATATGNITGTSVMGGLLGSMTLNDTSTVNLANVHATGNVNADPVGGVHIGGLLGWLDAYGAATVSITDASASGNVAGRLFIGGLLGDVTLPDPGARLTVLRAQASGDVAAESQVGGLIGRLALSSGTGASLDDVHTSGTVTALDMAAGGLLGRATVNDATLRITSASSTSQVTANAEAGGLIGDTTVSSGAAFTMLRSHATGDVTGTSSFSAGGLMGSLSVYAQGTMALDEVYATGQVTSFVYAGGLLGYASIMSGSSLDITRSYATGTVNDPTLSGFSLGGLIGYLNVASSAATLSDVQASGNVSGSQGAGGLVGQIYANSDSAVTITRAQATGQVSGDYQVGGLLGSADLYDSSRLTLNTAYAAGDVAATQTYAGGLVGSLSLVGSTAGALDIANVYALGAVTAPNRAGGLIGAIEGTPSGGSYVLRNSYASGAVSGSGLVGGLIAALDPGTDVLNSFWDVQSTGQTSSAAGIGMTTADMRSLANFTSATAANGHASPGWDISSEGGDATVWRIYEGLSSPVLRPFQTPASGQVQSVTKTYDGLAYTGSAGTVFTGTTPAGTVYYAGSSQGATQVGSYLLAAVLGPDNPFLASTLDYQRLADAALQSATLTITPAPLSIAANDFGKVYGQAHTLAGSAFTASGLQNGETIGSVALASTGSAAAAGVGSHAITASNASGGTFSAGNYTITYRDATLTVTPAALTITAHDAGKVYGQAPVLDGSAFTANGLQNGETIGSVVLASSGAAGTAAVGSYAIGASGAAGGSFSAGNYSITYRDGTLTVTPAPLTITAHDASKVYGQVPALGSAAFTASGLQNGETVASVALASSGSAATAGVGSHAVTASNAGGGTFSAGNYTITYRDGTLSVTPAPLTITANDASKTEGQTLVLSGTEFSATGLQNGETIGTVALASAGAAATGTVGSHTITASNAGGGSFVAGNYAISYRDGRLTVAPAAEARLPPKPYIVEEMERSVLAQDLARSRAAATATPQSALAATGASGVPFLTLGPTLVRVED